jgi:UDP-3-O-[3-hydroxymyristoyl] glucosamine N-acyltransferase
MAVDLRFYDFKGPHTLRTLSDMCGFDLASEADVEINGIAAASEAEAGDICFHEGNAKTAANVSPHATACFIKEDSVSGLPEGVIPIIVAFPRLTHIAAAKVLFAVKPWQSNGAPAKVHDSVQVAPGAFIGSGATIGENVTIGPNAVIGPGVQIGRDTVIGAGASIQCALIGNHVNILSGARIGESGFGVTAGPDGAEDVPQWGRVIIQDHVLIGGNTCVDRGAFTDTIIGERSKIDNLCQVGHNVIIGRNVLMASFSGISGTVEVGDGVLMGGRVGIADHLKIGDGAVLTADAGVMSNVPPGETWGGRPAKPFRQFLREVAWLQRQVKRGKKPSS